MKNSNQSTYNELKKIKKSEAQTIKKRHHHGSNRKKKTFFPIKKLPTMFIPILKQFLLIINHHSIKYKASVYLCILLIFNIFNNVLTNRMKTESGVEKL